MAEPGLTYKAAGVDIGAGNELAKTYLRQMRSTFGPQVLANDGGFAGLYRLRGVAGLFERKISDPLLVSGTDGVGTKLKIAFALDQHDTIGIDLVAMSVNDILVQGAEPLFFLDYIATSKIDKKVQAEIVAGVAEGCRQSGCALLGGETAELPGFYAEGEYDLAGFAVGVVERKKLVTGKTVEPGDTILGLASSGVHANGFSLARKALLDAGGLSLEEQVEGLDCPLGEELLKPTRIYAKPIIKLLNNYRKKKPVKALAHITGGGLLENIPRILPPGCTAEIQTGSWTPPPVFKLIARTGGVERKEMFRVFNMGIGMVLIVSEYSKLHIWKILEKAGEKVYEIGRVTRGGGGIKLLTK